MRTLPRNYSGSPAGDYRHDCDLCGAPWYRKSLKRKSDGMLYCPRCVDEVDAVTLSRKAERDGATLGINPSRERF